MIVMLSKLQTYTHTQSKVQAQKGKAQNVCRQIRNESVDKHTIVHCSRRILNRDSHYY